MADRLTHVGREVCVSDHLLEFLEDASLIGALLAAAAALSHRGIDNALDDAKNTEQRRTLSNQVKVAAAKKSCVRGVPCKKREPTECNVFRSMTHTTSACSPHAVASRREGSKGSAELGLL